MQELVVSMITAVLNAPAWKLILLTALVVIAILAWKAPELITALKQ